MFSSVHRTDGVLRLVLNTGLFAGMDFKLGPDPRYVRFVIFEDGGKPVSWMLRVSMSFSHVLIVLTLGITVRKHKARR